MAKPLLQSTVVYYYNCTNNEVVWGLHVATCSIGLLWREDAEECDSCDHHDSGDRFCDVDSIRVVQYDVLLAKYLELAN